MTVEKQFYYIRSNGEPTVTVCLLKREDGNGYARGVAVCSPLDNPVKRHGRSLAENRARGAIAANHPIPFKTYRTRDSLSNGFSSVYAYEDTVLDGLFDAIEAPQAGGLEDGWVATPNANLTDLEKALLTAKPVVASTEA